MIRTAQKWLRRHPKTTATAGAAVLALVVVSASGAASASAQAASLNKSTHSKAAHSHHDKKSSDKHSHKGSKPKPTATQTPAPAPAPAPAPSTAPAPVPAPPAATTPPATSAGTGASAHPLHTAIPSTTFWVGEIFDANASDGSQMLSTYDGNWFANYGGCDGVTTNGTCETEPRVAANGFFPSTMTPKQNPFYLDLPYDDVNNSAAFKNRGTEVPWANDPAYAGKAGDSSVSFMKNRWVKLMKDGQTCYGQIADAGPGQYHDAAYVFGSDNARPANARYGGAGMDVSPALNGCLNFSELNGQSDLVDWQFVEAADVPAGPWLTVSSNDHSVIN